MSVGLLKFGLTYGWIVYALLATRRMDDALDRTGVRRFVELQGAGFLAFDLVVRDVAALVGLPASDVGISLVQVGGNYPALLWMRRFLARRAVARPAEPLPADLKAGLISLGLSAREADVVALLLEGLRHKEIAERLAIAPETVGSYVNAGQARVRVGCTSKIGSFVASGDLMEVVYTP